METISQSEKAIAEKSLRFIFAVGAHCDDKTIVAPVIRAMVENAPEEDRPKLRNALIEIKFALMLLGDAPETIIAEFMNDAKSRRAAILVAENFARTARACIPFAVLKMAVPRMAKNHRVRQALRRRRCPSLACLCSPITRAECRIA